MVVVIWSYYKRSAHNDPRGEKGQKAIRLQDSPRSDRSQYWQESRNGKSRVNEYRG